MYKFWGWETADAAPVNESYKYIKGPRMLYDLLTEIWCEYTCAPRLREGWSMENQTLGQCSITAFLAQDIFGGKVYGILRPGGNYHCYNVIGNVKFDLTSEQFGDEVLDYENNPEQTREAHFSKQEKHERYLYLKAKLDTLMKLYALKESIGELGSLAVAYSAGVDSTFLLSVAKEVLGDRLLAVTAYSPFIPEGELNEAKEFCAENGIRHAIIKLDVLQDEIIKSNPADRCYHCKKKIFAEIIRTAEENGLKYVAEGSNTDDAGDYRPGLKALKEYGILSPLRAAGLSKAEIRELSEKRKLPTWNKPSYACLASRIAYGEEISAEKLGMIEAAEKVLYEYGYRAARVRMHGTLARIEVAPQEITKLAAQKDDISKRLKNEGFTYVTLDLEGYRTGSMNEVISGAD